MENYFQRFNFLHIYFYIILDKSPGQNSFSKVDQFK